MLKEFKVLCNYDTVPNEENLPESDSLSAEDNGLHIIVGNKRNGYVYRFQWNNRSESGTWNKVHAFYLGDALDQKLSYEKKRLDFIHSRIQKFMNDKDSDQNYIKIINEQLCAGEILEVVYSDLLNHLCSKF